MSKLDMALADFRTWVANLKFSPDPLTESPFASGVPMVMFTREDMTLSLTGEDAERYGELLDSLHEALPNKDQISRAQVSSLFDAAMIASVKAIQDNASSADTALKTISVELGAALSKPAVSWTLRLKVGGLAPSGLPARFGGLTFTSGDADGISDALLAVNAALDNDPDYSPEDREVNKKQFLMAATEGFGDNAIATIEVQASDFTAAKDLAARALQRTLDSFNFFANAPQLKGWAYRPGQAAAVVWETALGTSPGVRPVGKKYRVAPQRKIPMNQAIKGRAATRASILLNQKATPLNDRILASLQWAGRAETARRPEEAFMLYSTAFEALLLGRTDAPEIGFRLSLRCAHLLARNLVDRQLIMKQIRHLYKIRSRIVHSGTVDMAPSDLEMIREYCRVALFVVLSEEPFTTFTLEEELEKWFEKQLLGGESSPGDASQPLPAR
jgi:hypothetical protein